MTFLDWGALVVGGGLMTSGVRAIRRGEAYVPERHEGASAVRLGWLWLGLGGLFVHAHDLVRVADFADIRRQAIARDLGADSRLIAMQLKTNAFAAVTVGLNLAADDRRHRFGQFLDPRHRLGVKTDESHRAAGVFQRAPDKPGAIGRLRTFLHPKDRFLFFQSIANT